MNRWCTVLLFFSHFCRHLVDKSVVLKEPYGTSIFFFLTPTDILETEAVLKKLYCNFVFSHSARYLGDRNRPQGTCCLGPANTVFQEDSKWSVVREQWMLARVQSVQCFKRTSNGQSCIENCSQAGPTSTDIMRPPFVSTGHSSRTWSFSLKQRGTTCLLP